MAVASWMTEHWLDLVEGAGIIGSLLFAGLSFRADARERRAEMLREITKGHREIWSHILADEDTAGLLDPARDLADRPLTPKERQSVNSVLLHLRSSLYAAKQGVYAAPKALREDIRHFLSLPVPKASWAELKGSHAPDFVAFVEAALSGGS